MQGQNVFLYLALYKENKALRAFNGEDCWNLEQVGHILWTISVVGYKELYVAF